MSLITLEFEFGNDIDVLTNDVRDKLDMVSSELPDDVENPIIFKFSTDMIPIVLLSVQANESQSALYKILDDRVVNPLARIPGVGTVSISGAPQREIQVYCDPYKLEAYNLSIETISSIIGAENKNIPGGNFDIGNETYSLRVEGEFDDSRELADVVVGTYNGATVYLRDVARIVDTVEERAQETYNNGVQESTGGVAPSAEEPAERCEVGRHCGYVRKHSEHYRQFDGDGDVRPAVRRDCGIPVPGTLAGYIDYLYYDSAFSDCFVHIPGNIGEYD